MRATLFPLLCGHAAALCSPAAATVSRACVDAASRLALPAEAAQRVERFTEELLAYNERVNIYSKSAYAKLPFHVEDSLSLATVIAEAEPRRGVLDLGSGSGLPSLLIACVLPELPVFAVESKSRKTRWLAHAAKALELPNYAPLTQNVRELVRSHAFEIDVVTAKAFKPLPEVAPIARRCVGASARLLVPISEAQVGEHALTEAQLTRRGADFVYYDEALEPSHGVAQRTVLTDRQSARLLR